MKPLYDAILAYSDRGASARRDEPEQAVMNGFGGEPDCGGELDCESEPDCGSESVRPGPVTPFHMPGHKLGRGFLPPGVFSDPARFDLTELDETDDLHNPRGPLQKAQELAAEAFGAGRTWFLVNGSSGGVHAMILANCAPGQKLLIARDFHISAYHAMCLAGVRPVYLFPGARRVGEPGKSGAAEVFGTADAFGAFGTLTPSAAEAALAEHPDAAALYLTRPGYYGSVCDLESIVRIAHSRGVPVLVDEAHGAHLSFSPRLPVGALEAGADFCVQSAHKTLPAFTQCAYVHASVRLARQGSARIERLTGALRALQTS
ncbi:MAG: hypothetical protein LBU58_05960, partial [Clostridiales bacterium]|nr:hypothetical protein [Clostridiales bacterium]